MANDKTAVLVVSFGTTHLDTLAANIEQTEKEIMSVFPNGIFYRAFTSGIVRKRLEQKFNIHVDSVEQALQKIIADGCTRVVIQPTLLIPGEEFNLLKEAVDNTIGDLPHVIGRPLLCNQQDMDLLIEILHNNYPLDADSVLLLMGHGSSHPANDIYVQLANKMKEYPHSNMRLCTVEGTPDFAEGVAELVSMPQRKVHLIPLLLVAGDHAKNDMAGTEPDSLRSMLEDRGFSVSYSIKGLGELAEVRARFAQSAQSLTF